MSIRSIVNEFAEKDLEKFLEISRNISWKNFGKKIKFYVPSFTNYNISYIASQPFSFPSISITGKFCSLNCKHCNGKLLNTMIPVSSPEYLFEVCKNLKNNGAFGCLISGGCSSNGSVPIDEYITIIGNIKRDLGLKVVVHTGIVNSDTARKLKKANVDAAMLDIIGSNETIQEICRMNACVKDYKKSMKFLQDFQVPFVPHILVGLNYGRIKGEFKAIEIISKYQPSAVILIAFKPIIGTQMEKNKPPIPEDIIRILISTRLKLPNTPIMLGCIRPMGEHRVKTDILAIKAGVNGIAFPSKEAIHLAKDIGLKISFSPICCSQY